MRQETYQFTGYTPAEFEQFRIKMGLGQTKIADKIDYVASAPLVIGATYNRNQNVLNVVVTASTDIVPDSVKFDNDVLELVGRDKITETPVQSVPVMTPKDAHTGMVINQKQAQATVSPVAGISGLAEKLKAALAAKPESQSNFAGNLKAAFAATKTTEPAKPAAPILKPITPQVPAPKA